MSRKANLTTLYSKSTSLNLSNFNTKFYLLGLNFLKAFKQMLLIKNVLLCNETVSLINNKISLTGDLFFRSNKLKIYKKRKIVHQKSNLIKKQNILLSLIKTVSKKMKTNIVISDFNVLNNSLNKEFNIFLFRNLKKYVAQLFSRRFNLFIDFIKLTSLFFYSKIDIKTYLYFITEIFKFLRKRSHSRFFSFLKILFELLVKSSSSFELENSSVIKGIKLVIGGRLKGKPKASNIIIRTYLTPLQSLDANIEFTKSHTFTQNFGVFGFKMWVYKN